MRILILCTGNSCRSQMAEGFLQALDPSLEVFSAGTQPATAVHPMAIEVMKEAGIDLSASTPKNVAAFLGQSFDYVVTVCDNAKETCPVFLGRVGERIHIGFEDPAAVEGSADEKLAAFKKIRDEIRTRMAKFQSTLNN
jgi:arsenate reductase (thioredoxin)